MNKKALQITCGILTIVPILSGVTGGVFGIGKFFNSIPSQIELDTFASMDSQNRFLSIIWLGYAAIVWWIIPNIEKHTTLFRILLLFIFIGGLTRIYSLQAIGYPKDFYLILIGLEIITPLILIPWQSIVARKYTEKTISGE